MPPSPSHTWHWQPFGTPWKVPAIYPLTLSVAGHRSLLGKQGFSSYKAVVRNVRTTSGVAKQYRVGHRLTLCCTNTLRYARAPNVKPFSSAIKPWGTDCLAAID